MSFDPSATKSILKRCASEGVTFSNALFAACNAAWIRTRPATQSDLPMMMYAAVSLRPLLPPLPGPSTSYWFLSVGYFNVILPAFLSRKEKRSFWLRAKSARQQGSSRYTSPMFLSRAQQMARLRCENAKKWAKVDDEMDALRLQDALTKPAADDRGKHSEDSVGHDTSHMPSKVSDSQQPPGVAKSSTSISSPLATATCRPPSSALIGLSLIWDLDRTYQHSRYSPHVTLHALSNGTRHRQGGMLLVGYTFAGRLAVGLGWDTNGFEQGVVERFWEEIGIVIRERMIDDELCSCKL